ncbi:MAG: hypothetical protein MJ202_10890 [Lentisphaeria bacterium]|nr:hypothetical protein [Lentisphaeria bacterium]
MACSLFFGGTGYRVCEADFSYYYRKLFPKIKGKKRENSFSRKESRETIAILLIGIVGGGEMPDSGYSNLYRLAPEGA